LYHFGDGAGAVLFEPNHEGLGLQDEYLRMTVQVGRDFLKIDAGGYIPLLLKRWKRTDITSFKTENCFKYAVTNMADASELIMKRNNLTRC
jgi:3-oxoacyl-[acyl-carrier-protein] synthase-3